MNIWMQVAGITGVCVGVYYSARSIPNVQCEFLHYQPPLVTAEGIEFCANDNPVFLDLTRLSFPIEFDLRSEEALVPGKEASFSFSLSTEGGKPLLPHDLAITHTERLHLLIVDPSLEDYHHVHPEPIGASGEWSFSMTPKKAGTYRIFAEFVPVKSQRQAVATAEFEVGGDGVVAFDGGTRLASVLKDYQFELKLEPLEPQAGKDSQLTLQVSRPGEAGVVLQPVMGALAHMVAFDGSLKGYAHLHPKYTGREKNESPELAFVMNTSLKGDYRVWAQVKLEGEEVFAPFDFVVQ